MAYQRVNVAVTELWETASLAVSRGCVDNVWVGLVRPAVSEWR
jgi:hypothetical protein